MPTEGSTGQKSQACSKGRHEEKRSSGIPEKEEVGYTCRRVTFSSASAMVNRPLSGGKGVRMERATAWLVRGSGEKDR